MLKCEVCGKRKGFLASLTRVSHAQCKTMPVFGQIDRGEFRSFDDEAEILLEHEEHCLTLVRGCTMADPPNPADIEGQAEAPSSTPGLRSDGLVALDAGLLHVTDRRICFMGRFNSRTIPLSKVLEVRHEKDILMILAGDNRSATYFILESPRRVEITAAVVRKLAELAQTNQKPTVYVPPPKTPQFEYASD